MRNRAFTLDFSGRSGVPSQLGIDVAYVSKAFRDQLASDHATILNNVIINDAFRRRGVFNVTALTNDAAAVLEAFVLKVDWKGTKADIPLRKRRSEKPPVWVKFFQSQEGEMAFVGDEYFDDLLRNNGAVIVKPTSRCGHRNADGILNGVREAQVELGANHIGRFHTWTSDDGVEYRFKVQYRQQPFDCRDCNDTHKDGQCPRWKQRDNGNNRRRSNFSAPPAPKRILLFSDSVMRMVKEDAAMRVDVIGGAKIGHVANHINNDATILPHGEIVIVSVGRNMNGGEIGKAKEAVKAQLEEMAKVLSPLNNGDRLIFLVDPFCGGPDHGPRLDIERFIRAEIKRTATKIGCHYIDLKDIDLNANLKRNSSGPTREAIDKCE